MQRGAPVARVDAVARYREGSRAAMERLRAHAITHRRGFTLDVEIGSTPACSRWIRLIAEPICEGEAVGGLRGLKCLIARSEEHTSELQSLMRISSAGFCSKKKTPR